MTTTPACSDQLQLYYDFPVYLASSEIVGNCPLAVAHVGDPIVAVHVGDAEEVQAVLAKPHALDAYGRTA